MLNILNSKVENIKSFLEAREQIDNNNVRDIVLDILQDIKVNGDKALFNYCKMYDNSVVDGNSIMVTKDEIKNAYNTVDDDFIRIIRRAKSNIEEFHSKQVSKSWIMTRENGSILGQKVTPLESVGLYVPGGTASYPSSVLMNAIPARIAGVKRVAMMSPCKGGNVNPYTVVAASECGIEEIYKIGGAHAIGALAFGTESIRKVNKIVGPGNIYVATAKKEVFGYVDIDMIAGPSEILIIADDTANARYIAADMMSQAEHDELASSILISTSDELIRNVIVEIEKQLSELKRKDIIIKSLKNYGAAIKVDNLKAALDISNSIAPEHLEVMVKSPFELLDGIKNAGSIFLGDHSPEPLGDYIAGPNHVLPTGGTASFFSPLSVDDFIKKSSYTYYSRQGLKDVADDIQKFASYEGLTAHGNSIKVRYE